MRRCFAIANVLLERIRKMLKANKPKPPKLTDAERHARFKDMAREVGADESPDAFDRAFKMVVPTKARPTAP